MAATVKLDPAKGQELAELVTKISDGTILEVVQNAFNACRTMGDDYHLVEGVKEKFIAFQNYYNDNVVPAFNAFKGSAERFTDLADYVSKLQMDTSVKDVEVGSVASDTFNVAGSL